MYFHLDGLVAAVTADIETHVVSFFAQFAHGFVGNAALDFNVAAGFGHLFAGRLAVALVLPARGVARFLYIQAEVDLIGEDLHVTLRLHSAAHDAERLPRFAILHDESWNDGVKRALARRVNVGVLRI